MKTKKIAFYCIAVLLGGCVPVMSLQPLFTAETVVFDGRLLGTWNEPDSDNVWEFTRLEPEAVEALPDALKGEPIKAYRLNIRAEKRLGGSLVAALVKLQDQLYLDVFPDKLPSGQKMDSEETKLPFNAVFFVPTHTFLKVNITDDRLAMHITDDEGIQKLLEAEPGAIQCTAVDDRLVLTASTKELQAFVTKYANDDRVFDSEITLEPKRP
jgi:hypothetical protein